MISPAREARCAGAPAPPRASPQHRRLRVRVRIAFLVLVVLLVARHRSFQRVEDVRLHVRVGVLVDRDRAGGVSAEDGAEAGLHVAGDHDRAHPLGDVDHLLLLGGGQLNVRGVEHHSSPRYSTICHRVARSCTSFRKRGTVNNGTPRRVSRSRSTSRRSRSARMAWSVRKLFPVKRASVLSTRLEGPARSRKPTFPALSTGPSTRRMALLSSTSRMRLGARRKSSALLVGGVSSTITSKRPLE